MKTINIPKTHEFGWKLPEGKKERVFMPTNKCIWKRIEYIVEQLGGTIKKSTTGFDIEGVDDIHPQNLKMIHEEMAHFVKIKDGDYSVHKNEQGREEPYFEDEVEK